MSDAKAAERQRRYRIREKARAQALFAGAVEIPLAWFGINSEGHHVAIDADGKLLTLIVKTAPVAEQVTNAPAPTKRLYPPKALTRETYEKNVKLIRDGHGTKAQVHKELADNPEKGWKQFLALVDALPDGPDWADHFPEYPAEEFHGIN